MSFIGNTQVIEKLNESDHELRKLQMKSIWIWSMELYYNGIIIKNEQT